MRFFLFFFLLSTQFYSQKVQKDIAIIFDKNEEHSNVKNDTIVYQQFKILEQINHNKFSYFFNEEGYLITKIVAPGKTIQAIKLTYKNVNNGNPPQLKRKKDIYNILHYPKDFNGVKIDDFRKLLNSADNIYVIESDSIFGYYLLKKVEIYSNLKNE